jgi:hypothetical protein
MTDSGKKEFDFRLKLIIDGIGRPAEGALALFQRDPFPGGHHYQLTISGNCFRKIFNHIESYEQANIPEEVVQRWLFTMGALLSANASGSDRDIQYVLNTIEQVEYNSERIEFFGVCSPFIRG